MSSAEERLSGEASQPGSVHLTRLVTLEKCDVCPASPITTERIWFPCGHIYCETCLKAVANSKEDVKCKFPGCQSYIIRAAASTISCEHQIPFIVYNAESKLLNPEDVDPARYMCQPGQKVSKACQACHVVAYLRYTTQLVKETYCWDPFEGEIIATSMCSGITLAGFPQEGGRERHVDIWADMPVELLKDAESKWTQCLLMLHKSYPQEDHYRVAQDPTIPFPEGKFHLRAIGYREFADRGNQAPNMRLREGPQ